jgi:hypothetical protein
MKKKLLFFVSSSFPTHFTNTIKKREKIKINDNQAIKIQLLFFPYFFSFLLDCWEIFLIFEKGKVFVIFFLTACFLGRGFGDDRGNLTVTDFSWKLWKKLEIPGFFLV